MLKLLIKFIVGVLVTPVAFAVSIAFYRNILLVSELATHLHLFVWGMVSYVVLHLLFYKPTYCYVLGHEAFHAGVAWLFGGRIKSFKVSDEGGSVATDKSNVVIELSPYFVPIYAIIISVIYFVIASSYNIDSSVFVFLIAFMLTFHIVSTIEIMKIRQPDIVKSGYFFSIIMVYVLNIVIISMIFSLLFPSFTAKNFFMDSWRVSINVYNGIINQLFFK